MFDCIDCGACAYACPSEISLVEHYQLAKRELRKISIEKDHATAAKVRFEMRSARLTNPIERPVIEDNEIVSVQNTLEVADKKAVLAALMKARRK